MKFSSIPPNLRLAKRQSTSLSAVKIWGWHFAAYGVTTAVMAISGPFGTFGALTWPWRTLYWAICVGVPWLFLAAALELTLTGRSWRRSAVVAFVVGANLVVAAIIVATVWSLEWWLLPARRAALSLVEIYFYALTIGLAVSAVVTPIRQRQTMAAMVVDRPDGGQDTFFARLPPHIGGDLVHLRMRDHYIEVTTATGRDLVLMRFTDALASLPASLGGRVHRSHWVAWSHVAALIRHRGRLAIRLDNGVEVPVSRGYAKAVKARLGPPRG